jgi:1-phosphatidylinositol phosphodiesterase
LIICLAFFFLDLANLLLAGTDDESGAELANWMSKFSDDTKLVHMNLPATHDAATGLTTSNYRIDS